MLQPLQLRLGSLTQSVAVALVLPSGHGAKFVKHDIESRDDVTNWRSFGK